MAIIDIEDPELLQLGRQKDPNASDDEIKQELSDLVKTHPNLTKEQLLDQVQTFEVQNKTAFPTLSQNQPVPQTDIVPNFLKNAGKRFMEMDPLDRSQLISSAFSKDSGAFNQAANKISQNKLAREKQGWEKEDRDIKAAERAEQQDPNSEQSRIMREVARSYGANIPDSATYEQLAKISPLLEKQYEFEIRKQDLAERRADRQEDREFRERSFRETLADKQEAREEKAREKAEEPSKEQHKADVKLLGENDLGGSILNSRKNIKDLNRLIDLFPQMGATGPIVGKYTPNWSDAAQEAQTILSNLKLAQSAAKAKGQGAISDFERKLINMTIPDETVDADIAVKQLQNLMPELQASLAKDEAKYREAQSRQTQRGIETQSLEDLVGSDTTKKQSNERVTVVDKDGKKFTIPKNQLQKALDKGYKQL